MKKKGFTLIELLAVIIILAIIALIAAPIILGTINDTKEQSNERSVELYADSLKSAVVKYEMVNGKALSGNFYTTDGNTLVQGETILEVEHKGNNVVCKKITIKKEGGVYLAGCEINNEGDYTYGKPEKTPCNYTEDSNGYKMVACGNERFYVMYEDDKTVTMLSEYNLDVGYYYTSSSASSLTLIPTPTGIQNSKSKGVIYLSQGGNDFANTYGTTDFTTTFPSYYWEPWEDSYPDFVVTSYPAFVYGNYIDANGKQLNLVYPYVSAYEKYLKETLKVSSASASLMSFEQAERLGCEYDIRGCKSTTAYGTNENPAPEWVYSTSYWLGSAHSMNPSKLEASVYILSITTNGTFIANTNGNDNKQLGVRPVITISIYDIS